MKIIDYINANFAIDKKLFYDKWGGLIIVIVKIELI